MIQRLRNCFADAEIEVTDLTGTEDHWEVLIVSRTFENRPRIARQREVMDAFGPELKSGEVHALTIRALTPDEPRERRL